MQTPPQRAGIYCRLSYAPDGSLEKVERQEADCRDLAARLDWAISEAHIFPDNSRSAWQRNRKRPQWDRMLQAIDDGEIDGIIVYHGDRLIRQPHDLEKLISISDAKGLRIASPSGTRDLDSPDDRFILRIEAAQACRESDNTSRRVRRALTARLEKGLTQAGGRRPFGYGVLVGTRTKVDRQTGTRTEAPEYDTNQQVPEEAAILREAAEQLLAGQNQMAVVRWMNAVPCRTTEGNLWRAKTLRNLMLSPRIAGLIERDGQLYEAAWDGILSRETWEDVRALYRRSAEESPYAGRERVYLLSGVGGAECGLCGTYMGTKPSGGRNRKTARVYYCPGCKKVGRSVELLDAYVEGRALRLLQDPRLGEELAAVTADQGLVSEIAELERQRRDRRKQIENLADHPGLDAGLALAAIASFDTKIAMLRNRLKAVAVDKQLSRMVGISAEQWADEPLDVRSATVRALLRVIVNPTTRRGPGFDPASVTIERRRQAL
jgi:DNA invertase Pin-like site-specific DNA recombinase